MKPSKSSKGLAIVYHVFRFEALGPGAFWSGLTAVICEGPVKRSRRQIVGARCDERLRANGFCLDEQIRSAVGFALRDHPVGTR